MGWPYKFINLSDAEKHARRQALDRYAGYAQLAAFLPVAVVLIYRLAIWTLMAFKSRRGSYDVIPDSPVLKVQRRSSYGSLATRVRKSQWWLGEDVFFLGQAWGQRDEWVLGTAWGSLMLLLCVLQTGDGKLSDSAHRNPMYTSSAIWPRSFFTNMKYTCVLFHF